VTINYLHTDVELNLSYYYRLNYAAALQRVQFFDSQCIELGKVIFLSLLAIVHHYLKRDELIVKTYQSEFKRQEAAGSLGVGPSAVFSTLKQTV